MRNRLHFISGLPRSGSTLLAALLRQNPRFSAGMSSPVYALFRSMLQDTSARNEGSVFIDDAIRKRLLTGRVRRLLCRGDPGDGDLRHQPGLDNQIASAGRAFPRRQSDLLRAQSRLDPRQRRGPYPPQRIRTLGHLQLRIRRYGLFASRGSRSAAGMFGFAYNALREAVYGEQSDRLLIVRYESLVANPLGTLAAIYGLSARTCTRMIRATSSLATT